ncbi:MAG TPA: hypothetical protein PL155_07780 [Candidatus Omnitrophota bacterium]|nr:hypothetical protein [Candidatus Omnitrophota bacterium]HPD85266.1 hypothetical protein [Candidatus Omnitrophota bacterium]HRZ04233.1 hypothetical protein [Candidatus Omnitrophota bacterium]
MTINNYDESHIERKYFIDGHMYNCPFCNIRNVQYEISNSGRFSWSRERDCYFYLVKCSHCDHTSFHLSNYDLVRNYGHFENPPKQRKIIQGENQSFKILKNGVEVMELDEVFFYHQPTSFFTIDNRIPEIIRNLLSEAEGCRKMDYLVGASGCLRKAIYELLDLQEIGNEENDTKLPYEERIKRLKGKFPNIDSEYFDILAGIQGMTSDNLHEGSWDSFDSRTLALLIETTKEILYEIYVLPDEKKTKRNIIAKMREQFKQQKSTADTESKT